MPSFVLGSFSRGLSVEGSVRGKLPSVSILIQCYSIIAVGLTWRESLAIVAISFFIISFVISLNGATGVIQHAPFPVIARASWGFWGSYVAIISRAILAIFWFAIQSVSLHSKASPIALADSA